MIEIARQIAMAVKSAKESAPSLRLVLPVRLQRVSFYALTPQERQVLMRQVTRDVINPLKKEWQYNGEVDEHADAITATLTKGRDVIRFEIGPNMRNKDGRRNVFRVIFKGENAEHAARTLREEMHN